MNKVVELMQAIMASANCRDLDCEECKQSIYRKGRCPYDYFSDGSPLPREEFESFFARLATILDEKAAGNPIEDWNDEDIMNLLKEIGV